MTFMFLAKAQLTNKAFTDAGKGRIRQSLTALVFLASTVPLLKCRNEMNNFIPYLIVYGIIYPCRVNLNHVMKIGP